MNHLIAAISDFPVIVQGALGSALFALLLYLGQRAASWGKLRVAASSVKRRRRYLIEENIRYNVLSNKDFAARGAYVTLLLFRSSRSLFKALLWLTFGLITGTVLSVLGIVGYLGALYYLFAGLSTLAPPDASVDVAAKLASIQAELEALKKAGTPSNSEGES